MRYATRFPQEKEVDPKLIERAKSVDMLAFLQRVEGFHFKPSGRGFKCHEHDSLIVNCDRHRWFWNSQQLGGVNAVDYCMKIKHLSFRKAVFFLTGESEALHKAVYEHPKEKYIPAPKVPSRFVLLEQSYCDDGSRNYGNVIAYLNKTRGIGIDIINALIKSGQLYQGVAYSGMQIVGYDENNVPYYKFRSNDDNFQHYEEKTLKAYKKSPETYTEKCVSGDFVEKMIVPNYQGVMKNQFVVAMGYDEQGKPAFSSYRATIQSLKFRGDVAGSDKHYSFFMQGQSEEGVYVFESFIDAMSHAELTNLKYGKSDAWKMHNRLSLSGTSDVALDAWLKRHPDVSKICFCLDNDDAGRRATNKMVEKYKDIGYEVYVKYPSAKDYNEELINTKQRLAEEIQPEVEAE